MRNVGAIEHGGQSAPLFYGLKNVNMNMKKQTHTYVFSVYPYEGDKRIFKVKARTRANAYEKARYKNPFIDLIELDTIEL